MATQILTYPYGTNYRESDWGNQVKDGKGGSIPCDWSIYRSRSIQGSGSDPNAWWSSSDGQDNATTISSNNEHFEQPNRGKNQKGLAFWVDTNRNGYTTSCWFDIGGEGGARDGATMSSNTRSSWLREVTSLWFLFNGHDTAKTRDCYSMVEKAGIRYRDPNGYIRIKPVTQKLGNLSLGDWIRGDEKYMFGYALSSSERQSVCRNNWNFLGIRIQMKIKRGAGGTTTDRIQAGVTGLRLGLGESFTGWNTSNKRALVLHGRTPWNEYISNSYKDQLETR